MDKANIAPGDVIGRWTVLDACEKTEKGETKRLCRCECGTERYVLERSLRSGGSQSCGCLTRERAYEASAYDMLGKTFGELTVVGRSRKRTKLGGYWTCLCSCGYTCEATASELVTGRKTHCGCKTVKNYASADITGQRFGMLVALYPTKKRDKKGYVIWHCRCDCGSEADVAYNAMVYGNQISCGCKQKEHMSALGQYLTHVDGTSIDAIRSKKLPTDNTTGYKIADAAEARREAERVLFDGAAEHYRLWKEKADADPLWGEQNPIRIAVSHANGKLSVSFTPELGEAKQEYTGGEYG